MNTIAARVAAQVDAIMAASRARFGHGQLVMLATLDRLLAQRQEQVDFMEQLLARVETESRDLVDAEQANLRTARDRIAELDAQIAPLREFEEMRDAHRGVNPGRPSPATGEPTRLGGGPEERAYEYRSAGELIVDGLRASGFVAHGRRGEPDESAVGRLRSVGITYQDGALTRAASPHTTTAEFPGLLTPSVVGAIMSDIDAARPFISSLGAKDLGNISGETFKRPTVTQHVTVGKQNGQKTEAPEGQFKVGSVTFTKETYGGWTNVAKQLTDWLSAAAWNALLTDFQEMYGLETEDDVADAFVTAVTAVTAVPKAGSVATVQERLTALYKGASQAYAGVSRLPNHIWMSLDEWATWGPLIDQLKATTAGNGGGSTSVNSFAGQLLDVPRTVVPSFANGTTIIGVKEKYEVYEDRFGFLSAVEPKVFGVELAYGGYLAHGMLKAAGFSKVTFTGP